METGFVVGPAVGGDALELGSGDGLAAGAGDPEAPGSGEPLALGDGDGEGDGCGGIAYSANTTGRLARIVNVAAVARNATCCGGRPLLPSPAPIGGGVNVVGPLNIPNGVAVGDGVGTGVGTGVGVDPGAGLL